jgi:sulfhydrogenase subunit alpha
MKKKCLPGWRNKMEEITLNHICKIEGHASLDMKIEKGKVLSCELKASEGARFFEGLTLGKKVEDIQEIVTRICGICSSAHSVAAIIALEKALKITPTRRETIIRELLLLGERIRSHTTHLYFLALPDYIGYSAVTMAKQYKQEVDDALSLIRIGNKIIEKIGGREMHPFVKFHENVHDFSGLKQSLEKVKSTAEKTVKLFSSLSYPEFERKALHLCLQEDHQYAHLSGDIASDEHTIRTNDYKKHLQENIKEYATSKFVLHEGKPYLTGSMVRLNNNFRHLKADTKIILKKYKIELPLKNPFKNNIAQSIELYDTILYCIGLFEELEKNHDKDKKIKIEGKNGRGVSAVEAPRGTLFHEYEVSDGKITYCNIITPTAQNLNQMEIDIKDYVQSLIDKKLHKDKIVGEIEKLIRAYDPCFSCSTHFLDVIWDEK